MDMANQTLQARPVGAGLVAWSRGSGVPELGRWAHKTLHNRDNFHSGKS
jgi:hypothetical protein